MGKTLKDTLKDSQPAQRRCSYVIWYGKLSDDDKATADESMADPTFSNRTLHKAFRSTGLRMNIDYFTKHRNGECDACNQ